MPAISRIRFTNLIYENGGKRFIDDIFQFDGNNAVILLENGGGKTVFVQAAIQAVLPHTSLGERKARDTFALENGAAHIGVEWILNERPRRYALTAVTLFTGSDGLSSHKYVYEYGVGDEHSLEALPWVRESEDGRMRPAGKEEVYDYYQNMKRQYMNAHYFSKQSDYQAYIEENFKIIPTEWKNIVRINSAEGEVEGFFDNCKTTAQLVDRLLIPTVEEVLAGKGTLDFADTFEQQREHFKRYRQLLERIKESRNVEEKMNNYVEVYSRLYQAGEALEQVKKEAKALYSLASQELADVKTALHDNEAQQQVLLEARGELRRKEASYRLLLLEQELEKDRDEYMQVKQEKDYLQSLYDDKHKRLQNLEIAELNEKLRQSEEIIDHLTMQINNLNVDQDTRELEDGMAQNSAALRYCLLEAENRLLQKKQQISIKLQELDDNLRELRDQQEKKKEKNMSMHENRAELNSRLDIARDDMQAIARTILANPVHDKMLQEKVKWEQQAAGVEKAINDTILAVKQSSREKDQLQEKIPVMRGEVEKQRAETITLGHKISRIEELQNRLLLQLKDRYADLYYADSLYLKQSSIMERLEDSVEKLRLQKEELLFLERQASRMSDLYKTSNYFTADPQLEKWIEEWQNQFTHLEAGAVYVQNAAGQLEQSEEEIYEHYPFWAAAIVCLDNDTAKLMQRLEKYSAELSHPVFILTREEARALIGGGSYRQAAISGRQVFPAAWNLNLSAGAFDRWKKEIQETADRSSAERKAREAELARAEQLLQKLRNFYDEHPYEEYQQLLEERNSTKDRLFRLQKEVKHMEAEREQLIRELLQLQQNITELKQEQDSLSYKIQQAYNYIIKEKERDKCTLELLTVEETIKKLKQDLAAFERHLGNVQNRQKEVWVNEQAVESALSSLRKEALFKEVEQVEAVYTSRSRETLEIERKDLKDALNKKQQGRELLESKLAETCKNKAGLDNDLERKYRQCKYEIDQEFIFPLDGAEEINHLIGDVKRQEEKLQEINNNFKKVEKKYERQENKFTTRKEDFLEEYQEMVIFTEALPVVEKQLKQEKQELEQQNDYLEERARKLNVEREDIGRVIYELDKENGRYDFLLDEVAVTDLPRAVKQDFPYKRQTVVGEYVSQMAELKTRADDRTADLDKEKRSFELFCQQEVSDIKLRSMISSGIKYKKKYNEVIEWQSVMRERLLKIIRISEDDIREHDRELQQFINHLHTYILTLARELRLIPKKTRVKVDNSWKEIFSFDVPEWDEKEGKEELRRLVDYMIAELETDKYRNEQGEDDYVLIRKDIEKWLQAPQLLRAIIQGKSIKVKCRKVNVEGKISSSFNSWESSNQWSGGEKWSKNMALFLGILNYMAEKRQEINQALVRNRSVILDNPFGRASSDHVLDPVFFIAEQLGFQIIALTALAEGRFVRNYFPVVYSCRLRPSASEDKYIMTREKEINYAFFQDNNPEAIRRLGEHKQMELFK